MSASVARIAALGQVHREPIALGPHRIQDARRIQTTCIDDDARKQRVTMYIDRDVLERLKADGKGWQTRANALLRKAAGL